MWHALTLACSLACLHTPRAVKVRGLVNKDAKDAAQMAGLIGFPGEIAALTPLLIAKTAKFSIDRSNKSSLHGNLSGLETT